MAFCTGCGTNLQENDSFCGKCGKANNTNSATTNVKPALVETKYFEIDDVLVTNIRFIVKGQTYAMSGVTSVKNFVEEPSKAGPWLFIILGVLFAMGGFIAGASNGSGGIGFGIVFVVIGIIWYRSIPDIHHVALTTSAGELKALKSKDSKYINDVISALNQAIIHRG